MTHPPIHRALKYSLILGLVAIILVSILPILLVGHVKRERARLAACEREERIDCEPSVIWLLLK